jgi:F0F1-type ATP synthase epsilon subunit
MTARSLGTLIVRVLSPTNNIYQGTAVSVSARNKVGAFDVLAGHANFFSLLTKSQVVVDTGSQNLTFPINEGLLKVKDNQVTLFVDIEPAYLAAEEVVDKPT